MSAARFKSREDYFTQKSDLTKKVIQPRQKKTRKKTVETSLPVSTFRDVFCRSVEWYEIVEEGVFRVSAGAFDEALADHIDGESVVRVNPLDSAGNTSWNAVSFDLSETLDQPFSKALDMAETLRGLGIPSLLEVGEEGKGHYRLWIFHETPVPAELASMALAMAGTLSTGHTPTVFPSLKTDPFIVLPLQGETALLQRGVFVNTVGKLIKDQRDVLETIERCSVEKFRALIEKMEIPRDSREDTTEESMDVVMERPEEPSLVIEESTIESEIVGLVSKPVEKEFVTDFEVIPARGPSIELSDNIAASTNDETKESVPVPVHKKIETERNPSAATITRVYMCVADGQQFALIADTIESIGFSGNLLTIPYLKSPLIGTVEREGNLVPVIAAGGLFEGLIFSVEARKLVTIREDNYIIALAIDAVSGPYDAGIRNQGSNAFFDTTAIIDTDGEGIPLGNSKALVLSYCFVDDHRKETPYALISREGRRFSIPTNVIKEITGIPKGTRREILHGGRKLSWRPIEELFEKGKPKPVDTSQGKRIVVIETGNTIHAVGVDSVTIPTEQSYGKLYLLSPDARLSSPIAGIMSAETSETPSLLLDGKYFG